MFTNYFDSYSNVRINVNTYLIHFFCSRNWLHIYVNVSAILFFPIIAQRNACFEDLYKFYNLKGVKKLEKRWRKSIQLREGNCVDKKK